MKSKKANIGGIVFINPVFHKNPDHPDTNLIRVAEGELEIPSRIGRLLVSGKVKLHMDGGLAEGFLEEPAWFFDQLLIGRGKISISNVGDVTAENVLIDKTKRAG